MQFNKKNSTYFCLPFEKEKYIEDIEEVKVKQ